MSEESRAPNAIARLEAEGELVVAGGSFTLDTAAARTKLGNFALADHYAWVLQVVEATMLFEGASQVHFEIGNATSRARIIGARLDPEELRRIFDAVFASRGDARVEARKRLAMACHSIAGLEGRVVTIGSGGLTLELAGAETLERSSSDAPSAKQIEIVARDTQLGAMLTFAGPRRERELLATRALFAPKAIWIDGKKISLGFAPPACLGLRSFGPTEGPGRGVIGWDCLGQRSGIHFVANGVITEQLSWRGWKANVVVLVDACHLERDLSQAMFIRNDAFEELVAAVRAVHDDFDLAALELPRVRGQLPRPEGLLARKLKIAYVTCFVSIVVAVLAGAVLPTAIAKVLVSAGVVAAFISFIGGFVVISQLPSNSDPAQLGPAGVAKLLSRASVIRAHGPVTKVKMRVRVFSPHLEPHDEVLETFVRTDEVASFERGQWLWVHLPGDQNLGLHFDHALGRDRPHPALTQGRLSKALPPASE